MEARAAIVAIFLMLAACGHTGGPPATAETPKPERPAVPSVDPRYSELERRWGVQPVALRLTGGGHFVDFRYRVTDAEKAKPILSRDVKAYLEDHESGKVLTVPVTKLGTMRGTTVQPKEERQYFILFANTGKLVEQGRRVSVIVGDFRVEGLTVE